MEAKKYMLETYRATAVEIIVLEKYLNKLQKDEQKWKQTDIVKGSNSEFPYLPTVFKVSGFSFEESESVNEIRELQKKTNATIIQKKLTLERQKADIEDWLNTVTDPNIRSIIRLYYIQGLSWEKVCEELNEYGDGSTQRKQLNKFWKSKE